MKQSIEDINTLLKDGTFRDKQYVRFSPVGKICQVLNWNISNPVEFYTEFRVKQLLQQNINKDVMRQVDLSLFIPNRTSDSAEVFIEVKTHGKLEKDLIAGETQLQFCTELKSAGFDPEKDLVLAFEYTDKREAK